MARVRKTASTLIATAVLLAGFGLPDETLAQTRPNEAPQRPPAEGEARPQRSNAQTAPQRDVYYRNCDAARAAGAAPIYRGQPGYRPALDRDNDGIACEPYRGKR